LLPAPLLNLKHIAIIALARADWQMGEVEFAAICGYSFASLPMFIHYLLAFR
jgi:hypothetical protein